MVASVLLSIGGVVGLVGHVLVAVAAWRRSAGWGIGCLVVPLVSVIFAAMHWREVQRAMAVYLLGLAMVGGGAVLSAQDGVVRASVDPLAKAKAIDLSTQIAQLRNQVQEGEIIFRQESAALKQQFEALQNRRALLREGDNEAVAAFNTEATAYEEKTAALEQLRAQLEAWQKALADVLRERSELAPKQ